MSQKVLASHSSEETTQELLMEVRVDQVVLAREPRRALRAAVDAGLTYSQVEVSLAYPPHCISLSSCDGETIPPDCVPHEALSLGFLVAQGGAGFASSVHLERFSSPGRLVLTDEPRVVSCGGAAMLVLPASRSQLSEALRTGKTQVRPPRSIQILLSGRMRPFVCIRDVALEILKRGLEAIVKNVDATHQAPVILEFGGPGAKILSIGDRAVLCGLAPQLGAASALFASDEKTEIFLRDQRRSKAYRVLQADSGSPWEEVLSIDMAAVDPLLMDQTGRIRHVRDLAGERVSQVLLGGDTGISLRDWLAVSALLKSKRVSPGLDFLLCPSSRQTLEVLSKGTMLADFIASGARLIEPDRRVLSGELYPPPNDGLALRNAEYEGPQRGIIASPETLAFAIAHGEVGDPRGFKRPVRVTVPRNLPTDDILLSRGAETRGGAKGKGRLDKRATEAGSLPPSSDSFAPPPVVQEWSGPVVLQVCASEALLQGPSAVFARTLEDLRRLVENAATRPELRAVVAAHIPTSTVSILSGLGILALRVDESTLQTIASAKELTIPQQDSWSQSTLPIAVDDKTTPMHWLAIGAERNWAAAN